MTVRVGIIGAGTMGRVHALTIDRFVKNASVACIFEPNSENAAALLAELPGIETVDEPLALIATQSVDAIIIASPDHTHADLAEACIRNAKPVLCEKPLAESAEACRKIVAAEAAAGLPLVNVGFMRRFDPGYGRLKRDLEKGTIGRHRLIRCIHRNRTAPGFFTGDMGVTNAMVHEFDILRWLTGNEPSRICVSAPGTDGQAQDPILAVVEFSDGTIAEIEVFMNAGYGYDIRTEILGSGGVLEMLGHPSARIAANGAMAVTQYADFTERFADAYRLMLSDWVRAMGEEERTGQAASAVDGLRAMEIAEAAVKSLHCGDWVEVTAPAGRPGSFTTLPSAGSRI